MKFYLSFIYVTPLRIAAENNNYEIVNLLLKHPSFRDYTDFEKCRQLTQITIPRTMSIIKKSAFKECTSLTHVYFESSSCLKEIEKDAFMECTSLVEITIPDSVKEIGESAFSGCIQLKKIVIPQSAEKIGYNALYDCISLQEVIAPASLNLSNSGISDKVKVTII